MSPFGGFESDPTRPATSAAHPRRAERVRGLSNRPFVASRSPGDRIAANS
jgi:hypothetical protein